MNKIAIYPGTFDPITYGHLDIINRALGLVDHLIVAVATSASKQPLFSIEKREAMIKVATKNLERVTVCSFDTLLVDFAASKNASIIIRGLRAVSDFEYELQMGYVNHSLNDTIETVYLMPSLKHAFISSSIVRNLLSFDAKIDHLVPYEILSLVKQG